MPESEILKKEAHSHDDEASFESLVNSKDILIKEIQEQAISLTIPDKTAIVSRMLEHSIKDGLEIAKEVGLDRSGIIDALMSDKFLVKHKEFSKELYSLLRENEQFADESNKNTVRSLSEKLAKAGDEETITRVLKESRNQPSPKVSGLIDSIDENYLPYIKRRQVKQKALPDYLQSSGERGAESVIDKTRRVYEGYYFTKPLKELLSKNSSKALDKLPQKDQLQLWGDFISKDAAEKLLKKNGIQTDDFSVSSTLARAEYHPLDVVYQTEKIESERLLKKEIEKSLIDRGITQGSFEIVFDDTARCYKVYDRKNKSENDKEISFDLDKFEKKEILSDSAWVNIFDNQPVVFENDKYKGGRGDTTRIMFYDGKEIKLNPGESIELTTEKQILVKVKDGKQQYLRDVISGEILSNKYEEILSTKKINGQVCFLAKKGHRKFVVVNEGKEIETLTCENVQNLGDANNEITYEVINHHPAHNNGKGEIFVVNGENKYGPYRSMVWPRNVGGRLVYKDDDYNVVVNGQTIGKGDFYTKFCDIEGTLFYSRQTHSSRHGGYKEMKNEICSQKGDCIEYNGSVEHLENLQGKIAFSSRPEEWTHDRRVEVVYWGGERGPETPGDLYEMHNILGKEAFLWALHDYDKPGPYKHFYVLKDFKGNELTPRAYGGNDRIKVRQNDNLICILIPVSNLQPYPNDENVRYDLYTFRLDKDKELELTETEKNKISLLNLLNNPSNEEIDKHYDSVTSPRSLKDKARDFLEYSKSTANTVNSIIRESPQLFMELIKAKKDNFSESDFQQLVSELFPEIPINREAYLEKLRKEMINTPFESWFTGRGGKGVGEKGPGSTRLLAGYLEGLRYSKDILRLRQPTNHMILENLYGSYDRYSGTWRKVIFPLDASVEEPSKEYTIELLDIKGDEVNLPRLIDSKIIPERVKGIDKNGQEAEIPFTQNSLGEVRVKTSKDITSIVYSQSNSETSPIPSDISSTDYEKFKRDFIRRYGSETAESISLPEELEIFANSLKSKTPKEIIGAVENFCYKYGFYSIDSEIRDTGHFMERLNIMEQNMNKLKLNDSKLSSKRYAGVCADFAILSAALMREAGLVSGVAEVLVPEVGKDIVTSKRAHAVAYVAWPGQNDRVKVVTVDGTPANITPRFEDRQIAYSKLQEENAKEAEQRLQKLETQLNTTNLDDIKKLSNGELENILNVVLRQVKQSHLNVLTNLLNASRYSGINTSSLLDPSNIEDEIKIRSFIENEIRTERENNMPYVNPNKGAALLELFEEFGNRYSKDQNINNRNQAFDILEKVIDVAKKFLDPIEVRSSTAVITYLRAKRIK